MNQLWAAQEAKLEEKEAEIERLKRSFVAILESRDKSEDETDKLNTEIKRLHVLLARAADALEDLRGPGWKRDLIAELRQAAE